jgi:hypothetical protein
MLQLINFQYCKCLFKSLLLSSRNPWTCGEYEILVVGWSWAEADHRRQHGVAGRWTCLWEIRSASREADLCRSCCNTAVRGRFPRPWRLGSGGSDAADSEAEVGIISCNRSRWCGRLRGSPGGVHCNHWWRCGGLIGNGGCCWFQSEVGRLGSLSFPARSPFQSHDLEILDRNWYPHHHYGKQPRAGKKHNSEMGLQTHGCSSHV